MFKNFLIFQKQHFIKKFMINNIKIVHIYINKELF